MAKKRATKATPPARSAGPQRGASAKRPVAKGGADAAGQDGSLLKPFVIEGPAEARVFVGDSRQLLKSVPECKAGKVDLIFADPPFNWSRDYERALRHAGVRAGDEEVWDDAMPDADYLAFTFDWIDACIAALKPTGSLWINIPDTWAAEIMCYLKGRAVDDRRIKAPVHVVNWCIWHYRFGQNRMDNFISSKVHVLYCCKDPAKRTWNPDEILEPSDRASTYADPRTWSKKEGRAGLRVPMDVWYGPYWGRIQGNNAERRANHDNQIPEVYLERVIRCSSNPGELVLDPFLGSGTTCTVARELGRRSIGLEFSPTNARSAIERIRAGTIRVKRDEPTRSVTAIFPSRSRRVAGAAAGAGADSPVER